jgi:hypothetical protein
MESLEIKSSTTTGKLERKYRKVRSKDKAASVMENNKKQRTCLHNFMGC